MTDILTLTGLVATPPKHLKTQTGLAITSFRLASNQRRWDRTKQEWVAIDTNWYTITAFRQLANNVILSVSKGQRVVVTGRLRIRDWSNEEKHTTGTTIEVDAEAIGHDLSWGTALFTRTAVATTPEEPEKVDDDTVPSLEGAEEPGSDLHATREQEAVAVGTPF